MGGCFSKPKPVELKIEVVLPEKDRGKEELSTSGKGSPRAYQGNGAARHFHADERLPAPHPYPGAQDCVEAAVCHVKDLENGQMREVELGWGKVLLVKDGELHALGHKCPHYGAPLVKGVLSRGRVRCPWHGACFNVSTGDLEDFPGLDSLHKFQVKIEKEKVHVRASKQALQLQRRTKVMATCISPSAGHSVSTNVLIVGAGAAGLVCAETLRQEGFSDRIVLCTLDRHLPYDRPKLSKSLDAQPEQLALRPKEFFRAHGIEVLTEAQVVTVDVRNKKAVFKDGFKLEYSKLLLAPGSSPKTLSCKGKDVENVLTIRTPEDANRVVRLARGRNAVVVGAGFLGMEVAAYLTEKAHSVSVVEVEETPFRRFLGERVGRALMKMFENNRVKFYMQTEVSELRAQEGKLKEVVLKSSKVVRADVCVVGIGAVPATGFLRQSGISLDSRGFIPVNKMMQTSIPGVFAAGDAVTFPLAWRNNRRVNIPHWQMAHAQGTASPVAAASPRARPSAAACGPCSWGLPLRALQWLIRPASHRRWSRLAATSFPRPLQHPLGAQFRRHSAPAHCPCPSLSFPAVLKHHVPQKSSPTHAVTGGGEVSRTQSSSPLHPLWATRQTVKLAATCRPLGGGRLGLETHVPLPVGGHCTHLVQAPQLPVQPVSCSGRMARRPAPSSVLVTLAPSEPEAPLLVLASVQA
ncbi:apoptosis-inducing factor 3 isoform X2 [Ovis aries]|uniref:apoptosis-inducing factor 3 isoform X2 n=1 Tax=Ovis aries TaxID=9940 RepID=UPI00072F94DF|nr:apoptosis-inducing factor 3 isoform X2 [Ovis aries]XP_042090138.1 apoptosis-inducing factor 3 isoform X2 [Ovis aries]XP_042090139.1 apoptosis-inducing factor 3 isoform X2 [Ovis aries]